MNKALLKDRIIERLQEVLEGEGFPSAELMATEVLDVLNDEDLDVLDYLDIVEVPDDAVYPSDDYLKGE